MFKQLENNPSSGPTQTLIYDANGNMLTGLDGKVMTYDGEIRPLAIAHSGVATRYVYGADGARMKLIENAGDPNKIITLFYFEVEVRDCRDRSERK